MNRLFPAEWLKLRRRWMPRVILAILLGLIALLFWGVGTSTQRTNLYFPRGMGAALLFAATLGSFLWPVLAGSWSGNEYGWGTVRLVLSRRPDRNEFFFGGLGIILVSIAIALLASMVVGSVAGTVVAQLTGHGGADTSGLGSGLPGDLIKLYFASWYSITFYAALAFSAGTVFRSAAAAIGAGIGFIVAQTVAAGIFTALGGAWRTIADHFPNAYTQALPARAAGKMFTSGFSGVSSTTPSAGESVVALTIYIAVPLIVALLLAQNRDVTS